jgi:fission 1 protein/division protein 1
MFGHDGDHGDHDSLPDLEEAPPFPHPHHNPWLNDDPEEQDISNVHFTQTAPGRYNVQATIHRTVSPQGGTAPGSIGGFMALLNGLTGAATQGQGQPRGQGEGLFPGAAPNPDQATGQESEGQGTAGGPHFRRFTYQGGARFTQDGNGPVRSQPVDEITK